MRSRGTAAPRSAKAPIREVSAQYAVLDASPNAIVAIDARGVIFYVNRQVTAAFGYERDELIGRLVEVLLPERLAERHAALRDAYLAHPVARPIGVGLDLAGRRKDGSEFPVEIGLSPVATPDGLEVFATIVDISARKAAEAQLLQAQKLESLGRLAGGIAHDFNNMLFAIRGYAELLALDLSSTDGAPLDLEGSLRDIRAIGDAAERATNLTRQLLAFSRHEALHPRVHDLNAAVLAVEPMIQPLVGENLHLAFKLDPAAGHIRVDPGQLDQIIVNLVVNARDAMPNGGIVTIETGNVSFDEPYALEQFRVAAGPYVYLGVSDTGVGMDPEIREHVFEPFFTTKEPGKGTGLGLATIHWIVRQAGGHVSLYSEPGHGSSFKVYLPRVYAAAEAEVEPVEAVGLPTTGTVLVVEDERVVRAMTVRLLARSGYDVIAVTDGSEAITRIAQLDGRVDVVIADVLTPNMPGIELADWIMDWHPEVGVVLLSGYTPETLRLDRIIARGAIFVSKPVSTAQLVAAVQRAQGPRHADGNMRIPKR
jgi:PAS domain S-box-containing protein